MINPNEPKMVVEELVKAGDRLIDECERTMDALDGHNWHMVTSVAELRAAKSKLTNNEHQVR